MDSIKNLMEYCRIHHIPMISVDTKKKELIGRFSNKGRILCKRPIEVNDHDFPSHAIGKAVPYGIYDVHAHRGSVYVGDSSDTPQFAVECITQWFRTVGKTACDSGRLRGIQQQSSTGMEVFFTKNTL